MGKTCQRGLQVKFLCLYRITRALFGVLCIASVASLEGKNQISASWGNEKLRGGAASFSVA